MPSYLQVPELTCSPAGPIGVSSFICLDGIYGSSAAGDIYQARLATGTGDVPIGISQIGTDVPPNLFNTLSGGTLNPPSYAAQPGEPVGQVFGIGDIAPLVLGSGGASAGALLTWDASGHGVMTGIGSGVRFGAVALHPGNAADIINVLVMPGRA